MTWVRNLSRATFTGLYATGMSISLQWGNLLVVYMTVFACSMLASMIVPDEIHREET